MHVCACEFMHEWHVTLSHRVRVGLAKIGIIFAASQACFVVSGLPFLPMSLLGESSQGLHTPDQAWQREAGVLGMCELR